MVERLWYKLTVKSGEEKSQTIVEIAAKCDGCDAGGAHRYQLISFGKANQPADQREFLLCAQCARAERKRLNARPDHTEGLTRQELIAALDRFFSSSGASDICRRCHEQDTGC